MSKKLNKNKNLSSTRSFKTDEKLSKGNCETTFHNMLRGGENGHPETKMVFVPLKVNRCRAQSASHIFTGEDPSTIKESQRKHVKHEKSNIMFNDDYVEKNPRIKPQRLAKYNFEEKYKKNAKYYDELHIGEARKKLLERKINDNYRNNPMRILNKEENEKYNKDLALKNQRRTNAFCKYMGSDGCKRILGGIKRDIIKEEKKQEPFNKIINNNFNITQKSAAINKNEKNNYIPYYGKRQYRFASCGRGTGFVYLDYE